MPICVLGECSGRTRTCTLVPSAAPCVLMACPTARPCRYMVRIRRTPPGNEKGYVVSFKPCVDNQTKGNGVHLKKGQRIDVDAVYDVDPISTRSAPLPSGKHGGVMALFYYYMDCDPGSTEEEFVCRNKQCILVPARGTYSGKNSRAKCEEQCAGKPAALSESVLQDGIA